MEARSSGRHLLTMRFGTFSSLLPRLATVILFGIFGTTPCNSQPQPQLQDRSVRSSITPGLECPSLNKSTDFDNVLRSSISKPAFLVGVVIDECIGGRETDLKYLANLASLRKIINLETPAEISNAFREVNNYIRLIRPLIVQSDRFYSRENLGHRPPIHSPATLENLFLRIESYAGEFFGPSIMQSFDRKISQLVKYGVKPLSEADVSVFLSKKSNNSDMSRFFKSDLWTQISNLSSDEKETVVSLLQNTVSRVAKRVNGPFDPNDIDKVLPVLKDIVKNDELSDIPTTENLQAIATFWNMYEKDLADRKTLLASASEFANSYTDNLFKLTTDSSLQTRLGIWNALSSSYTDQWAASTQDALRDTLSMSEAEQKAVNDASRAFEKEVTEKGKQSLQKMQDYIIAGKALLPTFIQNFGEGGEAVKFLKFTVEAHEKMWPIFTELEKNPSPLGALKVLLHVSGAFGGGHSDIQGERFVAIMKQLDEIKAVQLKLRKDVDALGDRLEETMWKARADILQNIQRYYEATLFNRSLIAELLTEDLRLCSEFGEITSLRSYSKKSSYFVRSPGDYERCDQALRVTTSHAESAKSGSAESRVGSLFLERTSATVENSSEDYLSDFITPHFKYFLNAFQPDQRQKAIALLSIPSFSVLHLVEKCGKESQGVNSCQQVAQPTTMRLPFENFDRFLNYRNVIDYGEFVIKLTPYYSLVDLNQRSLKTPRELWDSSPDSNDVEMSRRKSQLLLRRTLNIVQLAIAQQSLLGGDIVLPRVADFLTYYDIEFRSTLARIDEVRNALASTDDLGGPQAMKLIRELDDLQLQVGTLKDTRTLLSKNPILAQNGITFLLRNPSQKQLPSTFYQFALSSEDSTYLRQAFSQSPSDDVKRGAITIKSNMNIELPLEKRFIGPPDNNNNRLKHYVIRLRPYESTKYTSDDIINLDEFGRYFFEKSPTGKERVGDLTKLLVKLIKEKEDIDLKKAMEAVALSGKNLNITPKESIVDRLRKSRQLVRVDQDSLRADLANALNWIIREADLNADNLSKIIQIQGDIADEITHLKSSKALSLEDKQILNRLLIQVAYPHCFRDVPPMVLLPLPNVDVFRIGHLTSTKQLGMLLNLKERIEDQLAVLAFEEFAPWIIRRNYTSLHLFPQSVH